MPKKSVIMHAEDLMEGLSMIVLPGKLTDFGAALLQEGPNAYSNEEIYTGQSVATVFSESKVRHWVNLCAAIIESGLSGDDSIQQLIENKLST
ncbi:MAG: hypothetical protein ACJA0N_001785 [Pseudohongiellaceae bacterium]|jgi:hypothetical protein